MDNVGLVNKTCKLAGIEKVNPDNIDLEDQKVWESISKDTTGIFQWESPFAKKILLNLFSEQTIKRIKEKNKNFSFIKLFSFGNGLIRPGCASFRDSASMGEFKDNGLEPLNEFLANELGNIAMQETIMKFLVKFCGYSDKESDSVRRNIAKKLGTEQLLPEIEQRFIEFTSKEYEVPKEKCAKIIKPFIKSILDASDYGFSWNHSDAYSCLGYECGYLRYYYPVEFITTALNIFKEKEEKTSEIVRYAKTQKIKILPPTFGKSKAKYFMDKEAKAIYKGVGSVKYVSMVNADTLYNMSKQKLYDRFSDVYIDSQINGINAKVMDVLVKLGYFRKFGNAKQLLTIIKATDLFYDNKKYKGRISKKNIENDEVLTSIVLRNSARVTDATFLDINAIKIIQEAEDWILSNDIQDFGLKEILAFQKEYLGYIAETGKEEDRQKLYIMECYPLKTKDSNKQFGYSVITQSIGSGVKARMSIMNRTYNNCGQIKADDIIYLPNDGWQRNSKNPQYINLIKYKQIF